MTNCWNRRYRGVGNVMTYKPKKHKGIFLSWLSSYLLILLIPLTISIFAYTQSIYIIETEINRANSASLKQVQQIIDSRLKDIEKLSVEIAFNEKIRGLVGYSKSLTPHQIYTTTDIIKDIKIYKIANAFINDLYVYFRYNNFVLGPNGKCTSAEFHEFYCKDYGQDLEEWLRMLNRNHPGEYKALGNPKEQGLSKKIIFARSLPIEFLNETGGVIVIGMDESTLIKALQDINWVHQGIIMVTDQSDNIILSTQRGTDKTHILKSYNFDKPQGLLHRKIKGEEYAVSYIKSDVTGWNYISVLPTRIFLDKATLYPYVWRGDRV